MLSHPLPVIALVSSYLTNKLIGPRSIVKQIALLHFKLSLSVTIGYYFVFQRTIPISTVSYQGITNPFATPITQ